MTSGEANQLLIAGQIGAARGLRGEAFVEVRTDRPAEVFQEGAAVFTDASGKHSLTIETARWLNGRLALTFTGTTTREDVEKLRGSVLWVVAQPEEDAWYPHELEGIPVVDPDGNTLGVVSGITQGAAHDLLLVKTSSGEVMVPFVTEIVPTVSVTERIVVVDAPQGLFDMDEA